MTRDETTDPVLRMLAKLPAVAPSPASVALVRARCHVALDRRQPASLHGRRLSTRILHGAVFAALSVYLAEAVRLAVHLVG